MEKIIIIDDDKDIANLISDVLEDDGYNTLEFYNGESALDYFLNGGVADLIILDIMMPGMDGLELCEQIREKQRCPIIFLTAKVTTPTKIRAFETGADDYITKPFIVDELSARIKAHLRREKRAKPGGGSTITIKDITINTDTYTVKKGGKSIPLSTREFQLLQYLMEHAGETLTREDIFSAVWNTKFGEIGTVAVNIKSIRDKLDPESEYIKTIWGVGYRFINQ